MHKIKRILIEDEEALYSFGLKLSESLKAGDVIALVGDLGAGKTTLTKAIAKGLGIGEMITSPTFTIVQEYEGGRLPLYHFDVYRICHAEEMYELGYEEYFYGPGVCVVEWANLIEGLLPGDSIRITLSYGAEENQRILEIEGERT